MPDKLTPEQRHKCMASIKSRKHEAGSAGEEVLVCPWVALPHQCEAVARHTRHRAEEIPHVHLRERVLLAWA